MSEYLQVSGGVGVRELQMLGIGFVPRRGGVGSTPPCTPLAKQGATRVIQQFGIAPVNDVNLILTRRPADYGARGSSERAEVPQLMQTDRECSQVVRQSSATAALGSPRADMPQVVLQTSMEHQVHRRRSAPPSPGDPQNVIVRTAHAVCDADVIGRARPRQQSRSPSPQSRSLSPLHSESEMRDPPQQILRPRKGEHTGVAFDDISTSAPPTPQPPVETCELISPMRASRNLVPLKVHRVGSLSTVTTASEDPLSPKSPKAPSDCFSCASSVGGSILARVKSANLSGEDTYLSDHSLTRLSSGRLKSSRSLNQSSMHALSSSSSMDGPKKGSQIGSWASNSRQLDKRLARLYESRIHELVLQEQKKSLRLAR